MQLAKVMVAAVLLNRLRPCGYLQLRIAFFNRPLHFVSGNTCNGMANYWLMVYFSGYCLVDQSDLLCLMKQNLLKNNIAFSGDCHVKHGPFLKPLSGMMITGYHR
jgi:hypothetical protein